MSANIVRITVLCFFATICCAQQSSVSTESLVAQQGYPLETHTVQTPDGYILTVHRIPYSPKLNNEAAQRPVAVVMHGMFCASDIWLLEHEKSLPYLLADAGYDVWLPNARGNRYSRNHTTLSPTFEDFWKFSWHEIGAVDVPAVIDYVLNLTGEAQVHFIAHSGGSTTFFVLGAINPSYLNRIRSAHLISPVVYWDHSTSSFAFLGDNLMIQPGAFADLYPNSEQFPNSRAFELITGEMCKDGSVTQSVCTDAFLTAFGTGTPYHNNTKMPEVFAVYPAGSSINHYLHFLQLRFSKKFAQFDYGAQENLRRYGTAEPPEYDLAKINAPVYIYYSDNDFVVNLTDTNRLIADLQPTNSLKRAYRIPLPKWNHFDSLLGIGADQVVHSVILEDLTNA